MTRHLLQLGHRLIAIVRGPDGNHDAAERHRGYVASLAEAGVPRNRTLELPGDFTESSGYDAAERLLRRRTRPTAIFAANDATAIGVLSALHDRGVRVPEDVAVAGFDAGHPALVRRRSGPRGGPQTQPPIAAMTPAQESDRPCDPILF